MKLSENPRSHEAGEIKRNLKKPDVCKSVSTTSKPLQMKKQPPLKVSGNPKHFPVSKKNSTETLELFEIAKKSADVANAKGLLAAKEETSICVDTLALLISFPICSTAPETRRIMEKLERLTKHKERKICSSASALLQHWRQSIRDQQHEDARSENPKSAAHESGEIKRNPKKQAPLKVSENPKDVCKYVSPTSRPLQMKKQLPVKVSGNPKYCPALKKNSTEMLELFEVAKKSADVANAKGLLAAKAESSICVDTLSLLISFPISPTAPETRQIMERLDRLTKHKDRRICNSASELFQHWRQSIRDQQRLDSNTKTRKGTM